MNLFIRILSFLVVIILIHIHAFAQECKAHLTIRSNIANVIVTIDDSVAGSGEKFELDLTEGHHKIIVKENNDLWDAKIFTDTLIIIDCRDTLLQYNFNPKVLLKTNPEDANVFSNDSLIGNTPLLIPRNLNNLRLEKQGYETKDIEYSDFGSNRNVNMNFIGELNKAKFFDNTLFKILVGSLVVLGAATAYLKLEADDKFDQYQITGDETLLDETNRLDTISAVTFVALQINFGYIIYRFLVD